MLRLHGEYLSSLLLPTLARDISGRQAERGHWPRAGRKSTCGVPRELLWLRRHKGAAVDGIWSYTSPPKAGRGLGGKPGAVTTLATAQLKPLRWLSSTAGDQTCKHGDALVPKHTSSQPRTSQSRGRGESRLAVAACEGTDMRKLTSVLVTVLSTARSGR